MSNEEEANANRKAVDRSQPDYVMIYGKFGYYRVTRRTAARIVRQLDQRFRPRWITFADLFNALIHVRTRDVEGFYDSSPSIRARRRGFDRALELEDEENQNNWE